MGCVLQVTGKGNLINLENLRVTTTSLPIVTSGLRRAMVNGYASRICILSYSRKNRVEYSARQTVSTIDDGDWHWFDTRAVHIGRQRSRDSAKQRVALKTALNACFFRTDPKISLATSILSASMSRVAQQLQNVSYSVRAIVKCVITNIPGLLKTHRNRWKGRRINYPMHREVTPYRCVPRLTRHTALFPQKQIQMTASRAFF